MLFSAIFIATTVFFCLVPTANDHVVTTSVMGPAATMKNNQSDNNNNNNMKNVIETSSPLNPTIEMMINPKAISTNHRIGKLFKEITASTASTVTGMADKMYQSITTVEFNIISMEDIVHTIKDTQTVICNDMINPHFSFGKDGMGNQFVASLVYDRLQLCPRPKTTIERVMEYIQHGLDVLRTTLIVNTQIMYDTYGQPIYNIIHSSYTACARILNRGVHNNNNNNHNNKNVNENNKWTAEEDYVDNDDQREHSSSLSSFWGDCQIRTNDDDHYYDCNSRSSIFLWVAAFEAVVG